MRPVSTAATSETADQRQIRVWDPLVRAIHWILVVTFFVAYFTEDDLLTLHVWAGYAVGVLVVLRVLWGFIGPKHARFSDFVYGPRVVWRYLIDLAAFRAKRYLGHSPAGGAMVIALLLGLGATVWSGLELYAIEDNAGPLAVIAAKHTPVATLASGMEARANESEREHEEEREGRESESGETWEELHEALANIMLALVLLHIVGVLFASLVHGENLTRGMVTGYKRIE